MGAGGVGILRRDLPHEVPIQGRRHDHDRKLGGQLHCRAGHHLAHAEHQVRHFHFLRILLHPLRRVCHVGSGDCEHPHGGGADSLRAEVRYATKKNPKCFHVPGPAVVESPVQRPGQHARLRECAGLCCASRSVWPGHQQQDAQEARHEGGPEHSGLCPERKGNSAEQVAVQGDIILVGAAFSCAVVGPGRLQTGVHVHCNCTHTHAPQQ
mmetsp:Transcript_8102/g.17586  ORF Transcript_8102/g.17586 Transcript_8102/m.17586 type:complete len:210 (+) Transcript_8102:1330-1959(+)